MADITLAVPLLTLAAAACFGVSANTARMGLNHLDSRTGAIIAISSTVICYLLTSPLWMRAEDWRNPGLLIFAAYGLVHPWLSRWMAYEANRRVGATISATFEANSPLLTAGIAVVLLGEQPTGLVIAGTLLTVTGIVSIFWNRAVAVAVMRTAALLALGAMTIRALLILISKVGLEIMPNPVMGAFATYAVSMIGVWGFQVLKRGATPVPFARNGGGWFLVTGAFTAAGTFCLFSALLHGQVTIVSPILASFPLFTMFVAWIFATERLSVKAVIGVMITVVGVALVSISSG